MLDWARMGFNTNNSTPAVMLRDACPLLLQSIPPHLPVAHHAAISAQLPHIVVIAQHLVGTVAYFKFKVLIAPLLPDEPPYPTRTAAGGIIKLAFEGVQLQIDLDDRGRIEQLWVEGMPELYRELYHYMKPNFRHDMRCRL